MLTHRSKFAQTAAALKSVPSWNFTPWRRLNVHTLPSGVDDHFSASAGSRSVEPCL